MLISEGGDLIQNNHYAVDSILPKCNELQHHCEMLTVERNNKRALLNQLHNLHSQLEKVNLVLLFLLLFANKVVCVWGVSTWSYHCCLLSGG